MFGICWSNISTYLLKANTFFRTVWGPSEGCFLNILNKHNTKHTRLSCFNNIIKHYRYYRRRPPRGGVGGGSAPPHVITLALMPVRAVYGLSSYDWWAKEARRSCLNGRSLQWSDVKVCCTILAPRLGLKKLLERMEVPRKVAAASAQVWQQQQHQHCLYGDRQRHQDWWCDYILDGYVPHSYPLLGGFIV